MYMRFTVTAAVWYKPYKRLIREKRQELLENQTYFVAALQTTVGLFTRAYSSYEMSEYPSVNLLYGLWKTRHSGRNVYIYTSAQCSSIEYLFRGDMDTLLEFREASRDPNSAHKLGIYYRTVVPHNYLREISERLSEIECTGIPGNQDVYNSIKNRFIFGYLIRAYPMGAMDIKGREYGVCAIKKIMAQGRSKGIPYKYMRYAFDDLISTFKRSSKTEEKLAVSVVTIYSSQQVLYTVDGYPRGS